MWLPPQSSRDLAPVWIEPAANGAFVLRWAWHGDFAAVFHIYIDSVFHGTATGTSYTLPAAVPGRSIRVDIVAGAELDAVTDFGPSLAMPARGGRLRVTIPAVSLDDNPDFQAYVLYWSDDGTDPTTEMARQVGANNNTFTTGILEDGTAYKFRAKLIDQHGNASDYGATSTASVHNAPLAPASPAVVYTQAIRTAVLTASAPVGQHADVAGYVLVSNYLPGYGLQPALVDDVWLAYVAAGGTITHTTGELCAGAWRFAWASVDGSGLVTRSTEVALNLAKSGGNLVSITAKPARPILVDAYSGAATIRARVRLESPVAGQTIRIYVDGVLDGTVAVVAEVYDYAYESEAKAGADYVVTATVLSGAVESDASDPLTVTVDATAPTGELGLTVEVVD